MRFHIIDKSLECKKYTFFDFLKKIFKAQGTCLYVLIDKNTFKKIYRVCLSLNKNVFTDFFNNNHGLKLTAISLFGDLKINDKKLNVFLPYTFMYDKIKIESKLSFCIYILRY